MRILAVADLFPWPATSGGLIRLATQVDALSRTGELDLFAFYDVRGPDRVVPDGVRVARLGTTPYPAVGPSRKWGAEWLFHRGVPLHIAMRAGDPGPRRDFQAFVADRYDVVWFRTAATWVWLGRPRLGPTIVDLDVLDDEVGRQQADLIRARRARGVRDLVARSTAEAKARLDAYDWSHLQRSIAREVDRVVLCSSEDVRRLGADNAVVVPNTYVGPERPAGKETADDPPTILFTATFAYGPNAEAARWLAEEIAPRIRDRSPGATVRLVGRSTPAVDGLAAEPGVTVTGPVPDMADELARADVVVVPVRSGSGTRLKILEAFAHRVPVVSTTLGAEGLGVVDGVHLLIADTPDAFADACGRLRDDPELRRRLVYAAEGRFRRHFESRVARERIRDLVDSVVVSADRVG
jgi:glycosyltransferase involved in cell wall biosynthesis